MSARLLQNAILLDTEATGLSRGSGLHELAIYDLQAKALREYLVQPNYVKVQAATPQETTGLATSTLDRHQLVRRGRWTDVIKDMLVMAGQVGSAATDAEVQLALEKSNPWLARAIQSYPHLQNKIETGAERARRLEMMRKRGQVASFTSTTIDPRDLLKTGGDLQQMITGKTIWMANAAYDSKIIGALTGGLEEEGVSTNLKAALQTSGTTGDPFYTTGAIFNQAKVRAQQTGDWTQVWKAMLVDTPAPGETAVRDIQDVLRSMTSYGQKLGLTGGGDVYWGSALDVVYRLMGSTEADKKVAKQYLQTKEVHRAAEDLALHSKYVLEKAVDWTTALQHVHEGTDVGKGLIAQAANKKGHLWEAASFFARRDVLKKDILEISLVQRLARAQTDLMEKGHTWQVDGWRKVKKLTQQTPRGGQVEVPILEPNRVSFNRMEDVVGLLAAQGKYGSQQEISAHAASIMQAVNPGRDNAERSRLLAQYLDQKTNGILEAKIDAKADILLNTYRNDLGKTVSRAKRIGKMAGEAAQALPFAQTPGLLRNWGMFAGAVATAGATWSLISGSSKPARDTPSLVTYSYGEWLQHQNEFYDMRGQQEQNQGMSHRGFSGALRGATTDFGSPYQGIMGSQVVFHQQEVLKEREKWLRQQYGAIHYDPMTGLFGMQGMMSRARHQGYTYIPDGTPVGNGYQNLRGNHLMKINLGDGNWKINVDDADTIVLKRGGMRGAVSSLFGLNKGYTFRLSGIDAPEISHRDEQTGAPLYHTPQPSGYASKAGLEYLLKNQQNLELVFNPNETTYGRMLGTLIGDNKNINYELVRRGQVAFLPYGKQEDDMLKWGVMRGLQTRAANAGRGMWQHPYWQAYHGIEGASNQSITFNTFTRLNKIAEKQSTMDTLALMEQAQAQGMYSSAMAIEASRIGKFTRMGADKVRPAVTGEVAAHYNSYMHEMISDTSTWMSTHGVRNGQNKYHSRGGYKNYDKALVLDSMGHTNSVWSRRKLSAFDRYGTGDQVQADRKYRMAAAQRNINNTIFDSQIKHTEY